MCDIVDCTVSKWNWEFLHQIQVTYWAMSRDFQQFGLCDQQRLRPASHTRRMVIAFAGRLNIL